MARAENPSLYRAMRHLRKGGLHRALHIPEDEPIPAEKLEAARHSKNKHIRKMAEFAHTMKGFNK
jgi:ribosomal protein L16/L10AE